MATAAAPPYPQGETSRARLRPRGRGAGGVRPQGETRPPIFGPGANAGWTAGPETGDATRPWRTNAETTFLDRGARAERVDRAARPGGRAGRHVQRGRQGIAAVRRHQLDLGDRRRLPRDVHAGRLRVPRDRL